MYRCCGRCTKYPLCPKVSKRDIVPELCSWTVTVLQQGWGEEAHGVAQSLLELLRLLQQVRGKVAKKTVPKTASQLSLQGGEVYCAVWEAKTNAKAGFLGLSVLGYKGTGPEHL